MLRIWANIIGCAAVALLMTVWSYGVTSAATIYGKTKVINGDTIVVGGNRISLYGIDAPKDEHRCIIKNKKARCGHRAGAALAGMIDGRPVRCVTQGREGKDRLLAICYAGEDNLNAWMVTVGWAEPTEGDKTLFSDDVLNGVEPPSSSKRKFDTARTNARILPVKLTRRSTSRGLSGRAWVIDGDTIEVARQRVRLFGIDAPESDQTCSLNGRSWRCGQNASIALTKIIGRNKVHCREKDTDRYGRIVAVCKLTNDGGRDINAAMVKGGWAMAYQRFSTEYVGDERKAREAKRGIWRGEFTAPWDYRQGTRGRDSRPKVLSGQEGTQPCVIKGNISSRGERIYHVQGGRYYGKTRISQSKGEEWFCSEAEARAAGWRKSKR